MNNQLKFRESLVECLFHELIGPDPASGGSTEKLEESPRQRYAAGVLFPSQQILVELEDASAEEVEDGRDSDVDVPPQGIEDQGSQPQKSAGREEQSDAEYDEMIRLTNAFFPSAIGVTFICDVPEKGLRIAPSAAIYTSSASGDADSKLRTWERRELELETVELHLKTQLNVASTRIAVKEHEKEVDHKEKKNRTEPLELYVLHRKRNDDTIMVTVSLINRRVASGEGPPSASDCYFQVGFAVTDPDHRPIFREYHAGARSARDPEEESLSLLYRNRKAYAVGHGCAGEWDGEAEGRVCSVSSTCMPVFTLAPIEPRIQGGEELSMYSLSGEEFRDPRRELPGILDRLASDYEKWIYRLKGESAKLPKEMRVTAGAHIQECQQCLERVRAGIDLLRENKLARKAFMLANRAMLMQQYHSRRPRRPVANGWVDLPTDYKPQTPEKGRWRSFQLAFILMNLRSLVDDDAGGSSAERQLVDLIWFPTGGGKTEAYLGLAAFSIFYRRMINPQNAGCTVLMRYTLRLLTTQQFQRASALICACELIRREDPVNLGEERISIGLWVGQSLSPNSRADAIRTANGLARRERDVENPFQILTCPWCGTEMDDPKYLGYVPRGSPKSVQLICPERRCPFSSPSSLPVFVVDEDIYDAPPSLIIGTVDKFAMLAWREQAGSIFGLGGAAANDPPDLIIQDELHLIAGPLGSVVGLYEGVIDLLASRNGRGPKIVASTATIRRARNQCRSLYDRDVFQFPPPGLDIADSFFACENAESAGRTYVGVFASAVPSFVTAQVRTMSAVLQGCRSIPLPSGAEEKTRDPYWTVIQYFNSLRELGHAATLVEADIPEYMWAIASRSRIPKELCRTIGSPVELTSRRSAQEIPEILERLNITYPRLGKDSPRPLDTLLATNMISVGVDVDRLGIMTIVGQPKTTSEYIQASSRVGRSKDAPGLVVTLLNPSKPRDRSHFEHFRAYHQAFYRHVEPTSVTPYSIPVIERALHAVLVIAARHIGGIGQPDQVADISNCFSELLAFLKARGSRIDSEHVDILIDRLQHHYRQWREILPSEWGRFGVPPDSRPLMYPAGTAPRDEWDDLAWATPSSMRSVDVECEAHVIGLYRTSEAD